MQGAGLRAQGAKRGGRIAQYASSARYRGTLHTYKHSSVARYDDGETVNIDMRVHATFHGCAAVLDQRRDRRRYSYVMPLFALLGPTLDVKLAASCRPCTDSAI